MQTIYQSNQSPKSNISKNVFGKRLSAIFGFNQVRKGDATATPLEKSTGIRFVKVDMNNPAYRFKQAALGSVFQSYALSSTLQKYFDAYMNETTQSYSDIAERQDRLNELHFMVANEPVASQAVELAGDEATQVDDQSRLISCESPSAQFINRVYELFAQWGITQQRVRKVCKDLEEYGEAVWTQRVTERGVEKITPMRVNDLIERLEFSPTRMAEYLVQIRGNADLNKDRRSKIDRLLDMLNGATDGKTELTLQDADENFSDMSDSKLLGFEFQDGIVVPPWCVTHFRLDSDASDFWPYGTPPLIHALAPFKQLNSTIILQGLARSMNFPLTLYKVKGTEGMPPATAIQQTNLIREDYENIGVTPQSNSLEVYTLNTKIWIPDGLLDIEVKESKVDMDFTGDMDNYQDRMFIAARIPKGYLSQEFGGYGQSGIALIEQNKPWACHVYQIQSAFLESISDLIRLHFAITGEFDYNTPFVLTMNFPAEDMGEEKRNARTASIELASSVIELITSALGLEEGDTLPEDVVFDIMSRYTFLDDTDIQKWMRYRAQLDAEKAAAELAKGDEEGGEGGDGGGGDDFGDMGDMGDDMGDMGDDGGGGDDGGQMPESITDRQYYLRTRAMLRERRIAKREIAKRKLQEEIKTRRRLREKRIREQYKSCAKNIYFQFLKESHLTEWKDIRGHAWVAPNITENSLMWESVQVWSQIREEKSKRLMEKTDTEIEEDKALVLDLQLGGGQPLTVDAMTESLKEYSNPNDIAIQQKMNDTLEAPK